MNYTMKKKVTKKECQLCRWLDDVKEKLGKGWHYIAQNRTDWKRQGETYDKRQNRKAKKEEENEII